MEPRSPDQEEHGLSPVWRKLRWGFRKKWRTIRPELKLATVVGLLFSFVTLSLNVWKGAEDKRNKEAERILKENERSQSAMQAELDQKRAEEKKVQAALLSLESKVDLIFADAQRFQVEWAVTKKAPRAGKQFKDRLDDLTHWLNVDRVLPWEVNAMARAFLVSLVPVAGGSRILSVPGKLTLVNPISRTSADRARKLSEASQIFRALIFRTREYASSGGATSLQLARLDPERFVVTYFIGPDQIRYIVRVQWPEALLGRKENVLTRDGKKPMFRVSKPFETERLPKDMVVICYG